MAQRFLCEGMAVAIADVEANRFVVTTDFGGLCGAAEARLAVAKDAQAPPT
jgi:hypothetical protein